MSNLRQRISNTPAPVIDAGLDLNELNSSLFFYVTKEMGYHNGKKCNLCEFIFNKNDKFNTGAANHILRIHLYTEEQKKILAEIYSIAFKKYYKNNPEAKLKNSETQKLHYKLHPKRRIESSIVFKKYYNDHPEARKFHADILKKYYKDPEYKKRITDLIIKAWENPILRKRQSKTIKKYFKNPEARKRNSEGHIKYYKDHPEARKRLSNIVKSQMKNVNMRKKISNSVKLFFKHNPNLRKKADKNRKKYYKEHPEKIQEWIEKIKIYRKEHPEISKCHSNFMKNKWKTKKEKLKPKIWNELKVSILCAAKDNIFPSRRKIKHYSWIKEFGGKEKVAKLLGLKLK